MFNVTSNVREVLGRTAVLSDQYRFAVARALTDTVKRVQQEMPGQVAKALDRPTEFTKRGFFIQPARKQQLVAVIGVKDRQAQYLQYQVLGGTRSPSARNPRAQALKLPGDGLQLDPSGNIKQSELRRLVRQAKASSNKARPGRGGARKAPTGVFGVRPGESGLTPGIYRRVTTGIGQSRLEPLVLFPTRNAKYKPRWAFHDIARAMVQRTLPDALRKAWKQAMASRR